MQTKICHFIDAVCAVCDDKIEVAVSREHRQPTSVSQRKLTLNEFGAINDREQPR